MANKLELTWFGKDNQIGIEPRILLENKSLSHKREMTSLFAEEEYFDNVLIHGDNLLALKTLENLYPKKIKCIYIDPPFNTGVRIDADGKEIGYDDGIEHSIWLSLMHARLKLLRNLLSDDGAIFIHLDDNEVDYCKVLCDEVFGRKNFMNRITVDSRSPSAFSTVNPGVFKAAEYILFYAKDRSQLVENQLRTARDPDYAYDKYILNIDDDYKKWQFINVSDAYQRFNSNNSGKPQQVLNSYHKFIVENAHRIFRFTAISDTGAGQAVVELKYKSKETPTEILKMERGNGLDDVYVLNGQQISFYSKNIAVIDGKKTPSMILTDIWKDIAWEGIASEGGVRFKKGKKPEKLIKRCLDLVTKPGDWVLDSFLGSGTTAAVAHKMHRRWIGIEMGEHAYSLCKPRLDRIINDEDKSGISKLVNWTGGGGYKFYELAPTLINIDAFGQPVINKDYNSDMLAAAVAMHEGF
ncbi:MAG: site-specific DNA-methyltransferase, partial [Bacilli bacterium]|nr:site-specific DNA-methyltransferase [Bacilli bacterium]